MRKYNALISYSSGALIQHTSELTAYQNQVANAYGGVTSERAYGAEHDGPVEPNLLITVYDPENVGPEVFDTVMTAIGRLLDQRTIIIEHTEVDARFQSTKL